METLKTAIVMIIMLIISLVFIRYCTKSEKPILLKNTSEKIVGKTDTVIQYDTIVKYLKAKGKLDYKGKPVTTNVNGRAVIVNPFVAKLDTAIGKDSFRIKYSYPLNEFELNFKRFDSIKYLTRTDTMNITKTMIETTPWYEYIIYALGGFVVGHYLK